MMKHITLAALLLSTAIPVSAQDVSGDSTVLPESATSTNTAPTGAPVNQQATPEIPSVFENVPGVVHRGGDDREDYWTIDDNDFVISRDKVTGVLRIGYVFSADGKDLSSMLTGQPPMTIDDVISSATFPVSAAGAVAAPDTREDALSPLVPEPVLEETDNALLENAPEALRNELLARLVERLEPAKSREEFQRIILEWREEARKELSSVPASGTTQEIVDDLMREFSTTGTLRSADDAIPAVPETVLTPDPTTETPTSATNNPAVNNEASANQPKIYDLGAAETPVADQERSIPADDADAAHAYATLETGSRWFGVGPADAPVIYMVVDPTCPFCSRALTDLEPAVRAGEVQLRIVPAPLLSESAAEVVAGVLLSENPAVALFQNAAAKSGKGGSEVRRRNFSDLPADVQADVSRNRQNVISLGITQIPYFAWETADGFRTMTGVPAEGDFQGDNAPLVAE